MFHTYINSGMNRFSSIVDMFPLCTLTDTTPKNFILNRFLRILYVDSLHDIIITIKKKEDKVIKSLK